MLSLTNVFYLSTINNIAVKHVRGGNVIHTKPSGSMRVQGGSFWTWHSQSLALPTTAVKAILYIGNSGLDATHFWIRGMIAIVFQNVSQQRRWWFDGILSLRWCCVPPPSTSKSPDHSSSRILTSDVLLGSSGVFLQCRNANEKSPSIG